MVTTPESCTTCGDSAEWCPQPQAPGCQFHGRDSGHGDQDCPATDYWPVLGGIAHWCQCPAADQLDRQRFFVGPDGHGWWDPDCKGLVQSG